MMLHAFNFSVLKAETGRCSFVIQGQLGLHSEFQDYIKRSCLKQTKHNNKMGHTDGLSVPRMAHMAQTGLIKRMWGAGEMA